MNFRHWFFLCLSIFYFQNSAYAGFDRVGNGGLVIDCGPKQPLYTLDYLDAKADPNFSPIEFDECASIETIVNSIISNLSNLDSDFARNIRIPAQALLNDFDRYLSNAGKDLNTINALSGVVNWTTAELSSDDAGQHEYQIPAGCTARNLAYQEANPLRYMKPGFIQFNTELFGRIESQTMVEDHSLANSNDSRVRALYRMTENDQQMAWIAIHESVLTQGISIGHLTTVKTRALTRYLFSNQSKTDSPQEYSAFMTKIQFFQPDPLPTMQKPKKKSKFGHRIK